MSWFIRFEGDTEYDTISGHPFEFFSAPVEIGSTSKMTPWDNSWITNELKRLQDPQQTVHLDRLRVEQPEHPFAKIFGPWVKRIHLSY